MQYAIENGAGISKLMSRAERRTCSTTRTRRTQSDVLTSVTLTARSWEQKSILSWERQRAMSSEILLLLLLLGFCFCLRLDSDSACARTSWRKTERRGEMSKEERARSSSPVQFTDTVSWGEMRCQWSGARVSIGVAGRAVREKERAASGTITYWCARDKAACSRRVAAPFCTSRSPQQDDSLHTATNETPHI